MFTNVTDHSVRPIVLLSRRYAQSRAVRIRVVKVIDRLPVVHFDRQIYHESRPATVPSSRAGCPPCPVERRGRTQSEAGRGHGPGPRVTGDSRAIVDPAGSDARRTDETRSRPFGAGVG